MIYEKNRYKFRKCFYVIKIKAKSSMPCWSFWFCKGKKILWKTKGKNNKRIPFFKCVLPWRHTCWCLRFCTNAICEVHSTFKQSTIVLQCGKKNYGGRRYWIWRRKYLCCNNRYRNFATSWFHAWEK